MYFKKLIFEEQSLIFEYFNKQILLHELNSREQEQAEHFAFQILEHQIPISKLIQFKHFWKFKLKTNQYTLDPRSDSEILIEVLLKKFDHNKKFNFIELGIGTGALSIAILHEFPNSTGLGIDISSEAIEVATHNLNNNIANWSDRYEIKNNDWLNNINENYDLCISNPPYLTHDESIQVIDPYIALYGGNDGCDFYRKIAEKQHLFRHIILEIGNLDIIKHHFINYEAYYDYKAIKRCLFIDNIKYDK